MSEIKVGDLVIVTRRDHGLDTDGFAIRVTDTTSHNGGGSNYMDGRYITNHPEYHDDLIYFEVNQVEKL